MRVLDKLKYYLNIETISNEEIITNVYRLLNECRKELRNYPATNELSLQYLNDPRLFNILCKVLGCYLPFYSYELVVKTSVEVTYVYVYFWPSLEKDKLYSIKLDPEFEYLDNNNKDRKGRRYIDVLVYKDLSKQGV